LLIKGGIAMCNKNKNTYNLVSQIADLALENEQLKKELSDKDDLIRFSKAVILNLRKDNEKIRVKLKEAKSRSVLSLFARKKVKK